MRCSAQEKTQVSTQYSSACVSAETTHRGHTPHWRCERRQRCNLPCDCSSRLRQWRRRELLLGALRKSFVSPPFLVCSSGHSASRHGRKELAWCQSIRCVRRDYSSKSYAELLLVRLLCCSFPCCCSSRLFRRAAESFYLGLGVLFCVFPFLRLSFASLRARYG